MLRTMLTRRGMFGNRIYLVREPWEFETLTLTEELPRFVSDSDRQLDNYCTPVAGVCCDSLHYHRNSITRVGAGNRVGTYGKI